VIRTFVARTPEGDPVTNDSATSSHPTPNAGDIVTATTGDARLNETLMSDPIGADVGPLPPIDAVPGGPSNVNGAIDGLPGRYERRDEEDAAAGLDMTRTPLGSSNG
jgi:hypothetical protein